MFGPRRNRLTVVGDIPSFKNSVALYCGRQLVLPYEAFKLMDEFVHQPHRFDELNHEIPFLRTCTLPAQPGSYETLVAIDHRRGNERFVIPVDIVPYQPSELVWSCNGTICDGKINRAVAKLIMLSNSSGGSGSQEVA